MIYNYEIRFSADGEVVAREWFRDSKPPAVVEWTHDGQTGGYWLVRFRKNSNYVYTPKCLREIADLVETLPKPVGPQGSGPVTVRRWPALGKGRGV